MSTDALNEQWSAREAARLRLLRLHVAEGDTLGTAMDRAMALCARTLGVDRVGVWLIRDDEQCIECVHLLDLADPKERVGEKLPIDDMGGYRAALTDRSVILVRDTFNDPTTAALVPFYLAPKAIAAMLDAPIYRDGRPIGVVCSEHRGGPRNWTDDDVTFALSMADIVSQLFAADELREAEAALHERERALTQTLAADAIGRLSRSVAHDLNNVLTLVLTAAGNLERNAEDPAIVTSTAAELRAAARDAAKLTRKLLTYAEPTPTTSTTSLDAILGRLEPRLRQLAGDDRVFTLTRGTGPVEVALDEAQLEQLLSSLVGNARDATGPGGHVSISTQRTNRAAIIHVDDDGEGMDELTLARAMEPFFTTRDDPARRGLGLAIVSGIIRSAGGNVEIDSRPNEGTRVRVQLPIRLRPP